ncbi:sensor histidine kinase [Roseococcus sp. YIM B11640]|uniref:sensor histidine kinase n=1 Tax=Roseococcus sp. YIM B11640 TaxID=3133973 RepID=UPI003C7EA33B
MAPDPIDLFLIVLACTGFAAGAAGFSRSARLRAEAATQRRLAAARARSLNLLARDLKSLGLTLLGRAQASGPAGLAFEGEARRLLHLSDAAAEEAGAHATRQLFEERFALRPALEEAVGEATSHLGPGRRDWRIGAGIGDATVLGDRRALRSALAEVLARAARATGEGDVIEIRAEARQHAISIIVEDEGAGTALADLSPREHDGTAERTRGMGLGLSLARSLLRAHGGELVIEAAPGVGARAFLSLPRERFFAA